MNIGTLTIEMAANVARLSKDMDAARRTVERTFGSIEKDVARLKDLLSSLFAGLSASAFIGKLVDVQAPLNITSLGAFGIESATPIVVPPSVATIFIGAAHERMINDGGVIYPAEVVTLSLTFDHKVMNGAGAAAFLQDVKREMESFKLPE